MVYMRNCLIDKALYATITEKLHHRTENIKHRVGIEMLKRHEPASESKTLMGIKRSARQIGRKQSQQPAAVVCHKRKVAETVGMVVHIVAVMQKSSVFRQCHESVPFLFVSRCISSYRNHILYFFFNHCSGFSFSRSLRISKCNKARFSSSISVNTLPRVCPISTVSPVLTLMSASPAYIVR